MMAGNELDELRDEIESYMDNLEPKQPFIRTVQGIADLQMELQPRDGSQNHGMVVMVEVHKRYNHYEDVKLGDDIENAPGTLGDFGQMLVAELEDKFDQSIELTIDKSRAGDEPMKVFKDEIEV